MTGPVCVPWEVAAERLGCGRTTVFGLVSKGKLQKPFRRYGRKLLITVDSLERLERSMVTPETEEEPELSHAEFRRLILQRVGRLGGRA